MKLDQSNSVSEVQLIARPNVEQPLSQGQRALWFLHRLAPDSSAYHVTGLVRLRERLDADAVERSFRRLVQRHAPLGLRFQTVDGEPRAWMTAEPSLDFSAVDASSWTEERVRGHLRDEAHRPFDLEQGALLRVCMVWPPDGSTFLLVVVHHIVADFWSLGVLMREFGAAYREEMEGVPANLPPLQATYADWARIQEERLAGAEGERLWSFWRDRLAGTLPVLDLPTDRPRPAVQRYHGAVRALRLAPEPVAAARALGRSCKTTLFATLLAAFDALLYRLTGQEDLLVGSPAAGRGSRQWAGLVGYFVNPVVLRADLSGDPSFRAHLERTSRGAREAFEHQELPFPLLTERLQPVRDPGRSPIFQAMFALQKVPILGAEASGFALGEQGSRLVLGGMAYESVPFEQQSAQFDLTLLAAETADGGLSLSFQYNTDLFDGSTAQLLLERLEVLLRSAASAPDRRVSELPLLPEAERRQVLSGWNETGSTGAPERLHDAFLRQAESRPEAVALVCGERRLSYGELRDLAGSVAGRLRQAGVGPEDVVGICMQRSPEMVAGMLGVLLAGGAYLPLDPSYPAERLAFMMADAAVVAVLTDEKSLPALPAEAPLVLRLDAEGDWRAWPQGGAPAGADHLAYLIYTSGSTGRPKGVAIEHRSASALLRWAGERFSAEDLAAVLASTSINFDLSVFELFVPLAYGGTVILVADALALPRAGGVTLVNTVPSALAGLLRSGPLPESVKVLNLAGEPLPRSLVEQAYAAGAVERVLNLYGPSEDTTYSTEAVIGRGEAEAPSIGRPLRGTRAYVLDRWLEPVPRGVVGEVCLGGEGLARGYLGRPELTAERFVPDPFGGKPGGRLYRTGDLARHLPDGQLDLRGRADHQVKIRGFRIELGEIERALDRHPGLSESVLMAASDAAGERALVAYLVWKGEAAPVGELRRFLRQSLPEHMIPSVFVPLPALPRTPNGKVDRRALPAPETAGWAEPESPYVAPRTPTEEVLAGIWAAVLGRERIGAADNFFELGGHSLKAVQVVSRLRDSFGAELPLQRLFEAPTLAGLAQEIERARATGRFAGQAPPLRRRGRLDELPLSYGQERLWFLHQLNPESPLYNVPAALRLRGPLDIEALAAALAGIVRRHEALRTVFPARSGMALQRVLPPSPVPLPVIDLSGLPGDRRLGEEERLLSQEARRPFDLASGPLLRAVLLCGGADDHTALLSLHHIVSDGWSLGVLLREIGALYAAALEHRAFPLPELPVQYGDFAVWQRSWLRGEVLEEGLAHWRQALAGAPALLELPADLPRPAAQSFRGAQVPVELSSDLSRQVARLGRRVGATPFMVLLSAFGALLSRVSRQEEVVVGSPVANRGRLETEGLIGFFVNTLALRLDLTGDPSFSELLERARRTSLAAYLHEHMPFEKLVEELAPERNLSASPLFQVLFALQNVPLSGLELSGLELTAQAADTGTAKFDLTLSLEERGDVLGGFLEYALDLFDVSTPERMAGHLRTLLAGAVADPEARLSVIPLLTAGERHQLLDEWNAQGSILFPAASLHEAVLEQARKTPLAPAVLSRSGSLGYGELAERACRLAAHLRSLGVGPEVPVGVCLERTPGLVVALLGVLAAGGYYVPLDPEYPRDRLAFILEDSRATVVVTSPSLMEALVLPSDARQVLVDGMGELDGAAGAGAPAHPLADSMIDPQIDPDNLAYLIYTSGSTGRPKAVGIRHGSASALVRWAHQVFSEAELAGVLFSTSVCFDLSVFELFAPLSRGGRVIVAANALELPVLAAAGEVTLVNTVPSAIAELVRTGAVPASVRTVNLAGEALKAALVERISEGTGAERVYNLYGPSEDTTYSTWERVSSQGGRVTIGRPLPGSRAYVLDRSGSPMPAGVPGELYLGGAGLARGYLGRPELTAERFVPNPFQGIGERLYRTGDLVRYLADGRLDFLGRLDHQVKVRGFRIELGEIEAVLASCPDVRETVVTVEDRTGSLRLVAYVATDLVDTPEGLESRSLRDWLRQRLPEPMVPSAFVMLPELPLTPNGKVDRKALPAPGLEAGSAAVATVARDAVEELLAGIWAEVLGRSAVGIHDSFFELGGHSLLATRVSSRVEAAFGVALPLRALFEEPTVAGLAARLRETLGSGVVRQIPPISPVPREESLPLSFAQERLWFLDQLEPGSAAYNISAALRLRGRLDRDALAASLSEIVRRHEVLRTRYEESRAIPVIALERRIELPLREARNEAEALGWAREDAGRPFDLTQAPVLRASLVRLGEEDHLLPLTVHHIAADGWSVGVFFRELAALYEAFSAGRPSPLPELAVQYADYAVWQRQWLTGDLLAEQISWWRERLAGVPAALDLPTDHPRPAVSGGQGGHHHFRLSPDLESGLRERVREEDATLFMILLAAFQSLLLRLTGQERVSVGSPIANRTRLEIEPLIGFFVNTLVLPADLSGRPSFRESVARVREMALGAYAHQDLPFEKLVAEVSPGRDLSRSPLFQVMFALQNAPLAPLELPGLTLEPVPMDSGIAKFDLTLVLSEGNEGFAGDLEYDQALFDPSTIERFAAHFQTLLAGAVADPLRSVAELPVLTSSERQQLLVEWNETSDLEPWDGGVCQLFHDWEEKAPEALAVADADTDLTYRELADRARELARWLRGHGVGPEVPVATYMDRSPELVVSFLGVLEAGGAYLPLDPASPSERLALLLEDTDSPVLLTLERWKEKLSGVAARSGLEMLAVDGAWEAPAWAELDSPAVDPDRLAYVIYTSGSTGRPKGVEVSHAGLANLARWHRKTYAMTPRDRATLIAGPAFDASVWEIWPALTAGAGLLIPDEETRATPSRLVSWLAAEGVTLGFLPTPLAEAVLGEPWPEDLRLRSLLTGGDRLTRRPRPELPFELINHYGPTEGSVVTSCEVVQADGAGAPSIGSPIANVRVYVVDGEGEPVPAGVPGELWIGGAGLARGYLRRPDITAKSFVPDPFGGQPGGRLYRTGDLVRRVWPEGAIEFLGRIDHQVKVRGFRIELGEIESALASCPGVRQAVVTVENRTGGRTGDSRLVAYVVAAAEGDAQDFDPSDLRERLRQRLPEHMVPSAFVRLSELPLTPNGKVDRKALPAPEDEDPVVVAAPRDTVEQLLTGIWAEVLGRSAVGIHDNFFELGGHSLLATRVSSRVDAAFGVTLPLRALFEEPTVAGLAARLREALGSGVARQAPPIRPVPREESLPLSFAQERLWFLERLEPGSAAYNIPAALRLQGRLDRDALAASLSEIVRRHEVLRTSYEESQAVPVIVLERRIELPLREATDETEALGWAREDAIRPFALAHDPVLRASLVRCGEEDHLLVLTVHHIAADGWSVGVFFRELAALYEAFSAGRPSPLPELAVQYADYAVWQRQWLTGDLLAEQISWWRERLAGVPATLDLPTDRPRPAVSGGQGGHHRFWLPQELGSGLRERGVGEDATPFMILLTAFQALLLRLTGQEAVSVGSPIANRTRLEIEPLIGFFVNTLVLPADLSGRPSFREAVARVREMALGAYAHQDLPFEKLVAEVSPGRDLSRSPLFQVMFVLQNAPLPPLELPGLTLAPVPMDSGIAKFDLTLVLSEDHEGFAGDLEYDQALFDPSTIERFAAHFQTLLAGAVADPLRSLGELPVLTAAEWQQIVVTWNETGEVLPETSCLHELFLAQAARAPQAEALVWGHERVTYGELAERAERLARHLCHLGVGPEVLVGVCVNRTPALVVALLAVLRAGGAYVPLDPAYPQARLAAMLDDSRASVVLTESGLVDRLPEHGARTVLLDGFWDGGLLPDCAWHGATEPAAVASGSLAYVIYTSGSTGRPKGVAIEHRSAMTLVRWARQAFSESELAGVLFSTSVCFDLSVFELFAPLSWGGRVIIAANALELPALAAAGEVTLVNTVPSAIAELVRAGAVPASVRTVNLAGEALKAALVERIYESTGAERVYNLYGPSEDTTYSTWERVSSHGGRVTIGRPLPGSRAYVLDRSGSPVPAGVPGELYLGGAGLARGYLGRPELTAERFVPNPFQGEGERLYRTGDLVRSLADGRLDFLGRLDHQVKVRGFRIELGEIESVLVSCPDVRETVVTVDDRMGERTGDLRLVAYVVGAGSEAGKLDPSGLRERLRLRLPDHMLPSAFVVLPELPRTPNGKVDRKALPAPGLETGPVASMAPRNAVEELLAGIWAEVLGCSAVGIHDSFFELGGHSLLATRVSSRVAAAFGVTLPLRALFEAPTVAALAARVDHELRVGAGLSTPPLVPGPREGDLPLSFAQQRLWFIDQFQPGSPLYNIPLALRIAGSLDVAVLSHVLTEVVRRHEALRTVFVETGGSPAQMILPAEELPISLVDLSGLAEERREVVALEMAGAEASRPFDLRRGPLFRAALLRLSAEDYAAFVTMHHVVSDGWSLGVLTREVTVLYAAFAAGRPSPLPELRVQYADFAAWQRSWLKGEVLDQEVAWWKTRLAGAPALLDLPTDRPRPAVQTDRGSDRPVRLSRELSARLREMARQTATTPFMVLLAVFQASLARWSGQQDITVGSPIAGRNHLEVEGLIGFFVNTLVLRSRLPVGVSFAALLEQVRETSLEAHTHQEVPFEKLVEELAPERSLSHSPLFQVMFALQDVPSESALETGGIVLRPWTTGQDRTAKFDLGLTLQETDGAFAGSFEHNVDLFDEATVERWSGHFSRLLEGALARPSSPLADLDLIGEAERAQVVIQWNDTAIPLARERCLHDLVEDQVRRAPAELALIHGNVQVSYGELWKRTAGLARELRSLGVGTDVPVAVCCERGVDLVVALLAVLRSGGAYLPLDPAYPAERLELMLDDSRSPMLLTQEHMLPRLSFQGRRVVCVDQARFAAGAAAVSSQATPPSLAYLMYTSGTSGRPKGVMVEHRSASWYAEVAARNLGIGPGERVLQFASISFDISVEEIFASLVSGAALVLSESRVPDPRQMLAECAAREVSVLTLPTAFWHELVNEVAGRPEALPASLRRVCLGGEKPLPEGVALWQRQAGPGRTLFNSYGPTETTVVATLFRVPDTWPATAEVPLGRPIAGARIHVVEPQGAAAPIGVPGELWIGGAGVARGYLGRPDLTAERFVPDPFGAPGGRLYRTGDRVRQRADGQLEFLGRVDQQVKVRGFRVEPGEIESALVELPGVRGAAVVARPNASGELRFVAYVVTADAAVSATGLREALRSRLPEHLVPAAWKLLEALPLTPNGKVDRRALPDLQVETAADSAAGAPRTPVEELLTGLYAELLEVERCGVEDNFFERGGHSLLAARLMSRLRQALGVDLPLRTLFEAPTVADLAARVESARRGEALPAIPVISRAYRLQLSFGQERLWFLQQLEPESSAYNLAAAFRLVGRLNLAALERCFVELLRRHEPLRTSFPEVQGAPIQVIAPKARLELPLVDLTGLTPEARDAEARRLISETIRRPFDLGRGPLLRVALLRLAAEELSLVAVLHHIISDGWSMGVLTREMGELYTAFVAGKPSPLPELPLQPADHAAWQREWLQGEVLERQLDYWRIQLAEAPKALALRIRNRPGTQRRAGAVRPLAVEADTSRALARLARREDATLFMVLLAGFQALLFHLTGQPDLTVGSPIANRGRVETEGLIGFFLNTLVLRADLSGDPSFQEIVARVREVALDAYAHQDIPFERLVADLQPSRTGSQSPLFRVWFVLQNVPAAALELPGLTLHPLEIGEGEVRHDLKLDLTETEDGLRGFFQYRTELFDELSIAALTEDLDLLLRRVAERPETRLSELCQELARAGEEREARRGGAFDNARHQELQSLALRGGRSRRRSTESARGESLGSTE